MGRAGRTAAGRRAGSGAHARLIRASEVGEYLYCRRAWWLRQVEGVAPDDGGRFARGELAHAGHYQNVTRARQLARLARVFVLIGFLLLLARALGWV
jgi:CRISPR/Cas system-associated exonuclease Cas4 (RecB family)